MNPPLLSSDDITALLAGQPITDGAPWAGGDSAAIDAHLLDACRAIEQALGARSRIEWDDYGSGYASFVDAWFYLPQPGHEADVDQAHTGLVVLFSRLSHYVVMMEGHKRWHGQGSSSYMPSFDMVDGLKDAAVIRMAEVAQAELARRGFVRIHRAAISAALPDDLQVRTNLSDPPYTQFDALFHWED